jgi:ABC-2 type transport system ATP-binding protein
MNAPLLTDIGIEIRGLAKDFGTVRALDGLSLSVEAGLLHGIIGPDGAGKTTLLRILAGLLRPSGGTVSFAAAGAPVAFEAVRPAIAYMPARASLYPDLSIAEHLLFFKDLYSIPEDTYHARSAELLAVTRLERFKDRRVGQLSGGMYKKAALMCSLLRSPAVLLLDEPTNGVDPISRREFWELLYGLAARRILVLVTTAYMDEAERCARVHLVDGGRVIRSGEPAALLAGAGVKSFDELFMKETENG